MVLPTSSPSPPPTPVYNNPNTGGDTGENDYALPVTAGINVSGSDFSSPLSVTFLLRCRATTLFNRSVYADDKRAIEQFDYSCVF
ncbi:hypothetical protein L6452_14506 [Arctium lappa]|uniref:Uncharacterized protein n=1 Tax=Arctium lappa TaxID=4217 RepID=A0ACB9CLF5_ARCLA|nr:hypothetical protein L6452_14506 [Arctium lappa]